MHHEYPCLNANIELLPSSFMTSLKGCKDVNPREEKGKSLVMQGIRDKFGLFLIDPLPSLSSILRYTSIFSTSHTLNDLLFGSNSLIVNRFWFGKLGHFIAFC